MSKFALIMNVSGESPETYSKVYEIKDNYNLFAGTGSMEMAAELVKKLADSGFELVNLCGDFDDEITKRFMKTTQGKMRIYHADYFPEEMAKLEAAPSLKEYGFLCIVDGLEKTERFALLSEECNTSLMLVKDLQMACQAAETLAAEGIHFIELCSWFDQEKTQAIIAAVDGKVPVGSCGLNK